MEKLGRGIAWLDTGTHDSLLAAANFIQVIEQRQGLKIACLEEIAFRMGLIDADAVERYAAEMGMNNYGAYLRRVLAEVAGTEGADMSDERPDGKRDTHAGSPRSGAGPQKWQVPGPGQIEGVKIKPLRGHPRRPRPAHGDPEGDDELFVTFGQVYMTTTYSGRGQGLAHAQRTDRPHVRRRRHVPSGSFRRPAGVAHPGSPAGDLHGQHRPVLGAHPPRCLPRLAVRVRATRAWSSMSPTGSTTTRTRTSSDFRRTPTRSLTTGTGETGDRVRRPQLGR